MEKLDGVTAVAVVLIASFAIDRIVAGCLFALSLSKAWDRRFPDPSSLPDESDRRRAEKKYKVVYFILAATLGVVVLAWLGNIRILSAMLHSTGSTQPVNPILDTIVTGLLLTGGADRLAQFLKAPGEAGTQRAESKPIQITGKLVLDDESGRRVAGAEIGAPALHGSRV